jgi:hypothetical protein
MGIDWKGNSSASIFFHCGFVRNSSFGVMLCYAMRYQITPLITFSSITAPEYVEVLAYRRLDLLSPWPCLSTGAARAAYLRPSRAYARIAEASGVV